MTGTRVEDISKRAGVAEGVLQPAFADLCLYAARFFARRRATARGGRCLRGEVNPRHTVMNMKQQVGVVAVVAVVMFGAAVGAEPLPSRSAPARTLPTETFTFKPGEVKDLPVKDLSRVAIEDPEIVDIVVNGPKERPVLHLTAGKVGWTSLMTWAKDGTRRTYELVVKN